MVYEVTEPGFTKDLDPEAWLYIDVALSVNIYIKHIF